MVELIVAMTILMILTAAAMPVVRVTIQRSKERELRRDLWEMRDAIDRYKDAADRGAFQVKLDSQGYPPDLETLVKGVDSNGKKLRFLRRIPVDPMTGKDRVGPALHAGRSRFRFLGRAKRLRRVHQVGRHRPGRNEIQDVVASTARLCSRRLRQRGFTLIELMVVICIIIILLSLAMPNYSKSILHAQETALRDDLYTLRSVIDQYTLDKQKAPQSLAGPGGRRLSQAAAQGSVHQVARYLGAGHR